MWKSCFLSLLTFALLLPIVNYIHFRYFSVNVVFYAALLDVAMTVALVAIGGWRAYFRHQSLPIVFVLLLMVCTLGGYIYAISIPTVIDRSFSMYLLEKLQQHDGRLKQEAFAKVITEEFMQEHHLGDARLTEQLESGTITIENGCVVLTPRGQQIASFTRWYRQNLLPSHRLLMGTYTDELTNPFSNPSQLKDYRC